ncbi:MAG: DUF1343 domain-containing protein [Desulfobulbaceae bacterium]|jgi:uncharacterized protein YbbC (DUF1343 family)|nr:DUF1343 domain-containing protein [Desulfobulbaceae bacterium]
MVSLGIEELLKNRQPLLAGKRIGLLCNQASTDRAFNHTRDLIHAAYPGQLSCILSPQHGFFAEKQDNMVESGHGVDTATGVPVHSLYGETRKPTRAMMDQLDVVVVDIVDVGTRVYTFMYTLAYVLEAAAEYGKTVLVLDRPNPIGGVEVEGNILESDVKSFVGLYPLPMRHGLTFGELGALFNEEFGIGADYHVIAMAGWTRSMHFPETGLPWVFPSPNMPDYTASLAYPGQVIWEGCNISEGRGTCFPFTLFGAPWVRPDDVLGFVKQTPLPGCTMRPLQFEPTFNKHKGRVCHGFQLHITDAKQFKPYRTGLAFLQAFMNLYPEFAYTEPPYEYEFVKLPMDLILGSQKLRKRLQTTENLLAIEQSWQDELADFDAMRSRYFLYSD